MNVHEISPTFQIRSWKPSMTKGIGKMATGRAGVKTLVGPNPRAMPFHFALSSHSHRDGKGLATKAVRLRTHKDRAGC